MDHVECKFNNEMVYINEESCLSGSTKNTSRVYEWCHFQETLGELLDPYALVSDTAWPQSRIIKPHNIIDSRTYHQSVPISEK